MITVLTNHCLFHVYIHNDVGFFLDFLQTIYVTLIMLMTNMNVCKIQTIPNMKSKRSVASYYFLLNVKLKFNMLHFGTV